MSIFGLQKMESVYASRIVIKVFLGQPGYAKRAFDNFEASKRFFLTSLRLMKTSIQGKIMPLQGLWPSIRIDGLKIAILRLQK